MDEKYGTERFAVAVSLRESHRIGFGGTTQTQERILYYYAEKAPETGIRIQALNGNSVPSGTKTPIEEDDFLKRFKPEPLIYYNQVKPRLEALEAELAKGEKCLEAERLDKAEIAFHKALAFDSENLRAIFGLGNVYLTGGMLDEARDIFEKIMSIEPAFGPDNKHLFNEFGIRMRKAGLTEMARAYYEKALSVADDDENLLFNVGRILFELGDFPGAVAAADKALGMSADFDPARRLKRAAEKKMAGEVAPAAGDCSEGV